MNTEKFITIALGLLVVVLVGAVIIYAQVVWKQYREIASTGEPTVTEYTDEPPAQLTPEENLEVLKSLATSSATSSKDVITQEEQAAILNSLSTGTSATSTDDS